MIPINTKLLGLAAVVAVLPCADADPPLASQPEIARFVDHMVADYGFDKAKLNQVINQVQIRQSIIDAITRPAEAKPWYQYRPIFLTQSRIRRGVKFMDDNRATLERAEKQYGVPPEIVTAILGVETFYGDRSGGNRVMDALVTLAFDYPARADFFRTELENYLLLSREEGLDPLSAMGSYAGAMGQPQFMPSSYRSYAVDFDGDGKRDLWSDTADAIGSVANYFERHGWERGGPVAVHAQVHGDAYQTALDQGLKPAIDAVQLKHYGIDAEGRVAPDTKAALIQLETRDGYDYWLGLQNFYVITRYNHSPLYAMAVYQLSQEIKAAASRRLTATK